MEFRNLSLGTGTTHKFTGDERDSETGLDHTLFRQYSSSLGRWSSPDPLAGDISDPQSLNRYSYVLNSPLNGIDPLGADVFEIPSRCIDPFGDFPDYCPVFGGDECASGSTCDGVGGGGGGGVVFGAGGSGGTSSNNNHPILTESNGIPPGLHIPGSLPNVLLPIDLACEFGVCNSSGATIAISVGSNGQLLCDGNSCPFAAIIRILVREKALPEDDPKAVGAPKTTLQCSKYLQGGTFSGRGLYVLCSDVFPNNPWSQRMRGCLQELYDPFEGYLPLPVIVGVPTSGYFDLNTLIPGTGAHLTCALNASGVL